MVNCKTNYYKLIHVLRCFNNHVITMEYDYSGDVSWYHFIYTFTSFLGNMPKTLSYIHYKTYFV